MTQAYGIRMKMKPQLGPAVNIIEKWYLNLHNAKREAGKQFQGKPYILEICVFDRQGKSYLHLVKNQSGICVKREEVK